MSQLVQFFQSTIGRKILMSLTGLALIGFLITHLAGNLLIFAGAKTFNQYSHALITNPLIYGAEAVLLALFLGHLGSGIMVSLRNQAARPTPYAALGQAGKPSRRTVSSLTMVFSGIVVAIFVPLHVYTFKYGPEYPTRGAPDVRDLHKLVLETFQDPLWVAWYVFAMAVIGAHLWHGFGSSFETLGVRWRKAIALGCKVAAVLIAGGFLVIPLVIYFKLGGKP